MRKTSSLEKGFSRILQLLSGLNNVGVVQGSKLNLKNKDKLSELLKLIVCPNVNLAHLFSNGCIQISAKRGPDLRFIAEANIERSSPKPRQSRVINLINRTQAIRPRVKNRVKYQVKVIS